MVETPNIDIQVAHAYFAKHCFNKTWDMIDRPERSESEEDEMLQLCLASLWHWTQREDCTITNLSIGYWQAARVFALLRQADNARRYANLSLEAASKEGVEPFYRGYAHEALARAEMVAGNVPGMEEHRARAEQIAATLPNSEEKQQLTQDLSTIH